MKVLAQHQYEVNGGYKLWLTLLGQDDMDAYRLMANGYGNGTSVVVSPEHTVGKTDIADGRAEYIDTRYERDLWDVGKFGEWGVRYLEARFGTRPTLLG